MDKDIVTSLREFMDNEAKSCSMDLDVLRPSMCIGCGEER